MTYIVMTSSACSPAGKQWRGYRNIALVKLKPGFTKRPKMISERAIGVDKIVDYHHSIYIGDTMRSAGMQLLKQFHDKADILNGGSR